MANFMELPDDNLRTVRSDKISRQRTASTTSALHPVREDTPPNALDCVIELIDSEIERATGAKAKPASRR